MKRYKPVEIRTYWGDVVAATPIESEDGEWVRHEDVKHIIDIMNQQI